MAVVNTRILRDVSIFLAMVALGVATRLVPVYTSLDTWNLNAILAIALFAGFYYQNRFVAFAPAAIAMLVGDLIIQRYDLRMMAVVYTALLIPVLLGPWLRKRLNPLNVGVGSLGAAVAFFIVSNGAYWWFYQSHTWSGLAAAYTQAVPFFRGTLAGTLVFSALLFGLYALATSRGWVAVAKPPYGRELGAERQAEPAAV